MDESNFLDRILSRIVNSTSVGPRTSDDISNFINEANRQNRQQDMFYVRQGQGVERAARPVNTAQSVHQLFKNEGESLNDIMRKATLGETDRVSLGGNTTQSQLDELANVSQSPSRAAEVIAGKQGKTNYLKPPGSSVSALKGVLGGLGVGLSAMDLHRAAKKFEEGGLTDDEKVRTGLDLGSAGLGLAGALTQTAMPGLGSIALGIMAASPEARKAILERASEIKNAVGTMPADQRLQSIRNSFGKQGMGPINHPAYGRYLEQQNNPLEIEELEEMLLGKGSRDTIGDMLDKAKREVKPVKKAVAKKRKTSKKSEQSVPYELVGSSDNFRLLKQLLSPKAVDGFVPTEPSENDI